MLVVSGNAARDLLIAVSVLAARLPGMLGVRPGRDRARPVGLRAVSWFRSHGHMTTALRMSTRAAGGAALESL
jgi:hypothetical protein